MPCMYTRVTVTLLITLGQKSHGTSHAATTTTASSTSSSSSTTATTHNNAYTFVVNPIATKTQIRAAVEELFNVRVEAVNTQNRKGKKTRFRTSEGKQPDWKKAVVTLNTEDRIEFF